MKISHIVIILLVLSSFRTIAQDTISLVVHPFVGDTIDSKENNYYNLFAQYPTGQFQSAQYLKVKSEIFVLIKLRDQTSIKINYSIAEVSMDMKNIEAKGKLPVSSLNTNATDAGSKLFMTNSKMERRIKKGKYLWIKTYSNNVIKSYLEYKDYVYVKVIASNTVDNNFLKVKVIRKGKPRIEIPLSDIQSIIYYSPFSVACVKSNYVAVRRSVPLRRF